MIKDKKIKKSKNIWVVFFLVLFFCLVLIENAGAGDKPHGTTEKSVVAHIYKNNNEYTIKKLKVINGQSDYQYDYAEYKGIAYDGGIVSFQGKSLGYFPANQMIIVKCVDNFKEGEKMTGGCQELPNGDIELRMPFFPNGKYANIYSPEGKKILTIDLSSKATCNENGNCDKPIEDNKNCPSDCKIYDQISVANQQEVSNPSEQKMESKTKKMTGTVFIILIIIALAVAVGAIVFWLKKRNSDEND